MLDQSWCRQKVRFSYQGHLLLQLIQVPVLLPLPSILTTILPGERERERLAWSRRIPWKSSAAVSLLVQDGDVENVDSSGKLGKKMTTERTDGHTPGRWITPVLRGGRLDSCCLHMEDGYINKLLCNWLMNQRLTGPRGQRVARAALLAADTDHSEKTQLDNGREKERQRTHPFTHAGHPDVSGLD